MTNARPRRRRWRIGELAEATGVTVRTLHHYEHIGLLMVSERTDGGHRMYDHESLQRVTQILALRNLGFSLPEIRKAIEGRTSLTDLLRNHLERIEREVAQATLLRDRIRSMTTQGETHVSVDQLPATLDAMSRIEEPTPSAMCAANAERWRKIRDELRSCMDQGEPPCSERAKAVARQARSLLTEIGGADSTVSMVLKVLTRLTEPHNLAGWDASLMQYLDLALAALEDQLGES
ncbi:MerR family transcriptional regulator [Bradyrhizobium sp. SSUT18]|uniref:MerR family transcriptional regulator n=1 Tax=Bradyrhizobium sp. SSUT18 TaxID=3040602 RepID=UPI00244C388E|nr:MerR family transcriptional regulator [Bradyrhizobium sp. SSUT18]MDH2405106.1 MerR family transcriptional regulator [Bradyrhizobium sp. SSUT18]